MPSSTRCETDDIAFRSSDLLGASIAAVDSPAYEHWEMHSTAARKQASLRPYTLAISMITARTPSQRAVTAVGVHHNFLSGADLP